MQLDFSGLFLIKVEIAFSVELISFSNSLKCNSMFFIKKSPNVSKNSSKESSAEPSEEVAQGEYDVSMFDTLSTNDALEQIKDGKKHVVYIGRATCGYCVQFLPSLQKAQEEYKLDKEADLQEIIDKLTDEMLKYAQEMEFEKAAEIRDKIKELTK